MAGGAGLIASFGAINEPAHSLDQLLALLGRWQFILWMAGTAVAVVGILVGSRALKLLSGPNSNSPRMRLFRGMAYGGVSGILSAHSLLVAKSAVELLVRTIVAGDNQFNRIPSWLILFGLVALALSQLYFLHRGLKLCSTSVLYPFVFCVYNIIAILDGLIYFRQTSQLSILAALMVNLSLETVSYVPVLICDPDHPRHHSPPYRRRLSLLATRLLHYHTAIPHANSSNARNGLRSHGPLHLR